MRIQKVTIAINRYDLPDHSDEHFDDWIKSRVENWGMDCESPLADIELFDVARICTDGKGRAVNANLLPHQQRVVDEKTDLDEKLVKLNGFFETEMFGGLDEAEKELLIRQAGHMEAYSAVLGERIAAFSNC